MATVESSNRAFRMGGILADKHAYLQRLHANHASLPGNSQPNKPPVFAVATPDKAPE